MKNFFKNLDYPTISLKLVYLISVLMFLGVLFGSLVVYAVFIAFSGNIPDPTKLLNRDVAQSTKIYDRNNKLLYSVYENKDRTFVPIQDISPDIVHATLAAEDAEFYLHDGIDIEGIARAFFLIISGRGFQGGSTITQQTVKNSILEDGTQRITRKIREAVLALQIENTYTKDEILQIYLNESPYGGNIYGVEAASKAFFGKSAKNLTLAESALIAGLPQSPTYYNPLVNPEIAKNRQKTVLKHMHEKGWKDKEGNLNKISDEEYNRALNEPLNYKSIRAEINAPHFVMYVLSLLEEKYGKDIVRNGGLTVKTTLDLDLQNEYQSIVKEEVDKVARLKVGNGALVALDVKNRGVLAMVGSTDYFDETKDGKFNVAIAERQPGSTLKPIVYAAGMKLGYTASTVFYDVKTCWQQRGAKEYCPDNYDGRFRGPVQLRYALAQSLNIPAVKMLDIVGVENFVNLARDLGVISMDYDPSRHWLALVLGGEEIKLVDLTNAFASLGDTGKYKPINPILEIIDSHGNYLEKNIQQAEVQVLDPGIAWIISDILSDNDARKAQFGSRSDLYIPDNKVSVKTGTSNEIKDNWTIGYTSDIAIGVWVGNNDNKPMSQVASGITGASPIWNRAMNYWLKDHRHPDFPKPDDVVEYKVGTTSGARPDDDKEGTRKEYFLSDTVPDVPSSIYKKVEICDDGEIKTRTLTSYVALKPEWQDKVYAWINTVYKDDEKKRDELLGPGYFKSDKPEYYDTADCKKKD